VIRQCRLPPDSLVAHDPVLYTDELSRTERNKHDYYQTKNRRKDYLRTILSELTPDDIRQLIIAEDELARCGDYVRIFPTQYTYLYHRFFEKPRYYNLLLDAWEFHYHSDRLAGRLLLEHYCSKKYHLQFRKDVSYRRIHVQVRTISTFSLKRSSVLVFSKCSEFSDCSVEFHIKLLELLGN
jgi:tubulin polyglutamylase TTLL4